MSCTERDFDPLLKDLSEKKQTFRRNVVSLATELKEAQGRLASKQQSFARETLTRQACDFCFLYVLKIQKKTCLYLFVVSVSRNLLMIRPTCYVFWISFSLIGYCI